LQNIIDLCNTVLLIDKSDDSIEAFVLAVKVSHSLYGRKFTNNFIESYLVIAEEETKLITGGH